MKVYKKCNFFQIVLGADTKGFQKPQTSEGSPEKAWKEKQAQDQGQAESISGGRGEGGGGGEGGEGREEKEGKT